MTIDSIAKSIRELQRAGIPPREFAQIVAEILTFDDLITFTNEIYILERYKTFKKRLDKYIDKIYFGEKENILNKLNEDISTFQSRYFWEHLGIFYGDNEICEKDDLFNNKKISLTQLENLIERLEKSDGDQFIISSSEKHLGILWLYEVKLESDRARNTRIRRLNN